ncbi:MAG: translation initiation factor IF-3 [Candidatus Cloacimonetes bacterium]|nr:translation initiation factor IF-3 [Candidatus Cloacimonadota bacterium]
MSRKSTRWQKPERNKNRKRINNQIRVSKVRLIGPEKEAFGIVSLKVALDKANDFDLDLVEIAPNANPPVCKIINYSKFLFDESKKAKEAKKKQQSVHLKEVKFRPRTDEHDYNFKLSHIKNFLEKNNKVKITIQFRGREMAHKELGYNLLERLQKDLEEFGSFESTPKMEGRFLITFVTTKKKS